MGKQNIKWKTKKADELDRLNLQNERIDVVNWLWNGLNASSLPIIYNTLCYITCRSSHQMVESISSLTGWACVEVMVCRPDLSISFGGHNIESPQYF